MSKQNITFVAKKTFALGDIEVGTNLTICMRCVAFDGDGEPLFRRIKDVCELGNPSTNVIPSDLIDHAKQYGSAHYNVMFRHGADKPWEVYGYCEMVTLLQAQMVVHNARLHSHDGFEITIEDQNALIFTYLNCLKQ